MTQGSRGEWIQGALDSVVDRATTSRVTAMLFGFMLATGVIVGGLTAFLAVLFAVSQVLQ